MPMDPVPPKRVRGVYGKPWSQLVGDDTIEIDAKVLDYVGKVLVRSIVAECRSDISRQANAPRRGQPYEIPDTEDFLRSFSHRVVGKSTVEVISTHPLISQVIEGRKPYPMPWLTRARGVDIVPIARGNGTVVFRMAPLTTAEAWIHPGFARHSFVERGIRKGREIAAKYVAKAALQSLLKGDPFR